MILFAVSSPRCTLRDLRPKLLAMGAGMSQGSTSPHPSLGPLLPPGENRQVIRPDPEMADIYVPPAEDSHPKPCPVGSPLNLQTCSVTMQNPPCRPFYPNPGWNNLAPDTNVPGILPGAVPGDDLGLERFPDLSLTSPIRSPLTDLPVAPPPSNKLVNCVSKAINQAQVPTLNAEDYYHLRFEQCNPYGGSYCQCTNNYIPLPTAGACPCLENGSPRSCEVCPYPFKVAPRLLYKSAMDCMKQ